MVIIPRLRKGAVCESCLARFGVRSEIKNMSSFEAIAKAIRYEAQRHINAIEFETEELVQETRRFDDATGKTFAMRDKETEADYRYFPDPNLMPIVISDEWLEEAEKRGLYNLKSLPDAMPHLLSEKNRELFKKHEVLSDAEIESRYEIFLENYNKEIHIEALTLQEMIRKDFTQGLVAYMKDVTNEALKKKQLLPSLTCSYESDIINTLDETSEIIGNKIHQLRDDTERAERIEDALEAARFYHDVILKDMDELRTYVDKAEKIIPDGYLPYPTYGQILFSLR